jgi:hypothetical protein
MFIKLLIVPRMHVLGLLPQGSAHSTGHMSTICYVSRAIIYTIIVIIILWSAIEINIAAIGYTVVSHVSAHGRLNMTHDFGLPGI